MTHDQVLNRASDFREIFREAGEVGQGRKRKGVEKGEREEKG